MSHGGGKVARVMARVLTPLAKARAHAGLTIEELAEKAGISVGTIIRLEAGTTRRPQLVTLAKLSRALGCTLAFLLDGQGGPE